MNSRPRPVIPAPTVQPGPKRPNQPPIPDPRQPLVGGILSISLVEDPTPRDQADNLLAEIQGDGSSPTERLLRLKLGVKWQVGESGEGAGWKFGDILDNSNLIIVSFYCLGSSEVKADRYRIHRNCLSLIC